MLNFKEIKPEEPTAVIKTSFGDIAVRFFQDAAPKAVENFLTHAENGYYNGVIFHRVIKGFMIQSGDPKGTGMGGESIWGKPFKNEVSPEYRNFRGALAMANASPDTNGSQFYIVQAGNEQLDKDTLRIAARRTGMPMGKDVAEKYLEIGGAPWLDGGYTVFGQVIDGMEIVDKIASVKADWQDKPIEPVTIIGISVKTGE